MSPFLILLIICTLTAIILWFKNASAKQGIIALKSFFIILGLIIVALIAIGRLPIISSIPLILLGVFKTFALQKILIPFIQMLAGRTASNRTYHPNNKLNMNDDLALEILGLTENPTREEIVKAHRQKMRELNNDGKTDRLEAIKLDSAREHLINNQ